jgi:predicted dehydrogenase
MLKRRAIHADARRAVFVGAGQIVEQAYLPAVRSLAWNAVLVDPLDERRMRLQREQRSVEATAPSLDDVASRSSDVLVAASPPGTHHRVVRQAIDRGYKRILIEKPPLASEAELDDVIAAAKRAGAVIRTSFVRRSAPPVRQARALFGQWRARLGRLRAVAVIEGTPWGWASVATERAGAVGLESILFDYMPHPLDVACHLAALDVSWAKLDDRHSQVLTPFELDTRVRVGLATGEEIYVVLLGSRTRFLANEVTFSFAGGAVTLEMRPPAGLIMRTRSGHVWCKATPGGSPAGPEAFALLLREAAGELPARDVAADLEDWRSPQRIMSALEELQNDRDRRE